MIVKLHVNKSVEENAGLFFDRAKKAKKKREGVLKTIEIYNKKLLSVKDDVDEVKENSLVSEKRTFEWFEKFHWFYTSEGFLAIGGRDATTNDILIKKHLDSDDLVFHTDMAGSPFFVLKKKINIFNSELDFGDSSISEVASATASYSRAWKKGLLGADVFYVLPEQVSKTAQSGEYLSKGSFMIRGKTNYVKVDMKISIGLFKDRLVGGPFSAISSYSDKFVTIVPGDSKTGEIAKKIHKKLSGDLDEIIRFIPAGGSKILSK